MKVEKKNIVLAENSPSTVSVSSLRKLEQLASTSSRRLKDLQLKLSKEILRQTSLQGCLSDFQVKLTVEQFLVLVERSSCLAKETCSTLAQIHQQLKDSMRR